MAEPDQVFVPPSAGGRSQNPHVAKEGIVTNPGVKTVPVGQVSSGPTCPSCHKQSLKVRHNRAQGEGRIYCSECGYEDSRGSSQEGSEPKGPSGVQIKSSSGSGALSDRGTGVRIRTGRSI